VLVVLAKRPIKKDGASAMNSDDASSRRRSRREEPIGRCVRCTKGIRSFESISVAGKGEFCYPCFNDDTAAALGVRFDNAQFEPLTLYDAGGRPHTFRIRSMLVPTGHEMEALEIQGDTARGYHFQILGDFDDDAMALFGKLYERMRAGLARQHVKRGRHGWQLTDDHRLTARIDANLEDDARLPLLVIDGKEFSLGTGGTHAHDLRGLYGRDDRP